MISLPIIFFFTSLSQDNNVRYTDTTAYHTYTIIYIYIHTFTYVDRKCVYVNVLIYIVIDW